MDLMELDNTLNLNLSFFRGYIMSNLHSVFTQVDPGGHECVFNRKVNDSIDTFITDPVGLGLRLAIPIASTELLQPQITEIIIGDGINNDFKTHRILITEFNDYRVNLCKIEDKRPLVQVFQDFKKNHGLDILEWAKISSLIK